MAGRQGQADNTKGPGQKLSRRKGLRLDVEWEEQSCCFLLSGGSRVLEWGGSSRVFEWG